LLFANISVFNLFSTQKVQTVLSSYSVSASKSVIYYYLLYSKFVSISYAGMIMRALNTLPGQDDSEKLVTNQKQIEELNITVDCLKNELSEKTNRIEELCRLANDFRDDTDRIKTEVCLTLLILFSWFDVTANNNLSWFMMLTYNV